ncbi:glycerophosphodiester phosphodiesterase family protein [Flavobacterium sp.]|uniref:glycerophosphodiester phosphodiesterase n=1 Tax=Flavobacterium sp. TaxID=239 RepID=UPI00286E169F|nr:glycerophosphodiester phosphodiesterase family protein [Flavobacterium sp.]
MLKIGHRGAKGHEPENTLIAFQKAIDLGCHGIEIDVHLSLDKEIIVIHDEKIDRTTNGKGFVNQMTLSELRSFRIDGKHQIPTLEEVIDMVNNTAFINIELKSYETVEKVIELIEKYVETKNMNYRNFIISSFDWNALQQVRFLNDNIQIGVLTATDLDLGFSFAKFIKAKTINPYFHLLNQENVTKIQNKGIEIHTWTVNEIEDIQKMKALNVDAIISDFPNRI